MLGAFEDEFAAVLEIRKTHEMGTFFVQRVSEGDKDYTVKITSPSVVIS